MQFSYHENSGQEILEIENDLYKYLIKARRHKENDQIAFRNLKDTKIYFYTLVEINRRNAIAKLVSSEEKIIENQKELHLVWCMVDPKTVEKSIASLNEIGVKKITFVYCEYSQKNFKVNLEKLEKILINSSSQCGRSSIIKLEISTDLEKFLEENNDCYALDFSKNSIESKKDDIKTIVLGCEGGFSIDERKLFDDEKIVGFDSSLILRSETAAISLASKILI